MTLQTEEVQRIDLHVHSKYAGRFKLAVLNSLEVEECYTEPQALYEGLMARGMTMVTITDHDAIDGCLEIAHHGPHVFISEEVSARFPENGCIVHVCTYGITEAQHVELQRLRYNIYELVRYIRQEGIVHTLAHPFSPVNQRLTPDLLKKSLLLFDTVEVINGQKDPGHARFVRDVIAKVDRSVLERWSNRYGIEVDLDRTWKVTAGSDDHSGVTMARAFTEFRGPATIEGLSHALKTGAVEINGFEKTSKSYAHTALVGTVNYFRHSNRQGARQTYMQLIDFVRKQELPDDLSSLPPVLQRIIPSVMETLAEADSLPSPSRIAAEGHMPGIHDELYGLIQGALLRSFRTSFEEVRKSIETVDLEPIIDELPTLIRLALFNLPYYFGFRYYYGERRRSRALYEGLELEDAIESEKRAAIFCDTIDNVDGVSIGLRRLVKEMRDDGKMAYLCGAQADNKPFGEDGPGVVRFPTIGSFPLLGYTSYTLGWPSLLEVVRWLDESEIDVVVVSTPGPVGLVAMMAARMLGIPIVGQYHTNVPEYAFRIIGDRTIGRMVRGYISWFYSQMQEVIAPTYATREIATSHGIPASRMCIVGRGVDSERFHPRWRNPSFWRGHGLRGRNTLLYVGRVSVEKNLPFLCDVFRELVDAGHDLELAVVGDGPWLETMKERLAGYPVVFTGYLKGDALAAAFASADLFVFPSTTDTFGNVVLESLAAGLPALVSDLGGPAEIVHHQETGLILPSSDAACWKDAIVRVMGDPNMRKKMSVTARSYAQTCTFARALQETWSVYERNIDRHRAAIRDDIR